MYTYTHRVVAEDLIKVYVLATDPHVRVGKLEPPIYTYYYRKKTGKGRRSMIAVIVNTASASATCNL